MNYVYDQVIKVTLKPIYTGSVKTNTRESRYMLAIALIIIAYLIGSLSSAIIVCKIMGLPDPRTQGSGNPGATNILRLYGKKLAIIVLAGDLLKGLLPLIICRIADASAATLAIAGLAALLGHIYPVFFKFQGGKGVATFVGVCYGFAWQAGLSYMIIWSTVAYLSRYSSLSALIATVLSPLYLYYFVPTTAVIWSALIMGGLVFYRHASNIKKLLAGEEKKIGT